MQGHQMNNTVITMGTAIDKTGAVVKIKYCNRVGLGPVELMSFFYRNEAELIENGHGISWPNFYPTSHAVYVEIENKIVGHIVFNYIEERRQTHISLSAVDKEYRKRGLYKIMHLEFEKISKKLGAIQITSFVHVNNTVRLESAKSVDFHPEFYKMVKYI